MFAAFIDVIAGKGNTLEQYVFAGSSFLRATATRAGTSPLQNGLVAKTKGIRAARVPRDNIFVYNIL